MFTVKQRTHEIGTRRKQSAGAASGNQTGLVQFTIGLAVGLLFALRLARMLVALIYGAQRGDVLTFVVVSVVLSVTDAGGVSRACAPRRAHRPDPGVAIRVGKDEISSEAAASRPGLDSGVRFRVDTDGGET
jgi:hypothetical protein